MNTWNEVYQYHWGYWFGLHPAVVTTPSRNYDPNFWRGYANGTVDYWLKRKGLK